MSLTKKGEITIVLGDFNAKVGAGPEGDTTGCFGLGVRNSRGDRLVQFCTEQQLSIVNTYFKLHPRRLYTWKSPADREGRVIRNQIDFILISSELRKFVKSSKTYPGADVSSDHNPVVMELRMRRFVRTSHATKIRRIDVKSLDIPDISNNVGQRLEKRLEAATVSMGVDVEEQWAVLKEALIDTQETDIGYTNEKKKQPWMTKEILQLMSERRQYKTKNPKKYGELNKEIRRRCRETKEQWLVEQCREIEIFQTKHDLFNVHKKIREMTGKQHRTQSGILRGSNNEILVGVEEKLKRWAEYVQELFSDERPDQVPQASDINEESPCISTEEVVRAIKLQKKGKAIGPDRIHAETLKLIAERDGAGLKLLTSLFNTIYRVGKIPSDWLTSVFVTLPKKAKAKTCDDYRMISLMSHVLKTFLRIIHTRIYTKCEQQIDPSQFGFRKGLGTREALFSLNVLTQRCRDMNVNVYACFVDYRKAFDCVSHQKMTEILKASGIDHGDLRIITDLYWHQNAQVRVDGAMSEKMVIQKGVRQGCVLSPLLFNLYSETIFREALEDTDIGIKMNGKRISNLRYADDTVVIADSLTDAQRAMDRIVEHSQRFGLFVNIKKTKLMVFSKQPTPALLYIDDKVVEQVPTFRYLGASVNEQCDPKIEIKARIEQARRTFINMKNLFTSRDLSLQLRVRLLRCYIFPVLLYGCESWTFNQEMEKRIDAFEMYLYRRILRIPWIARRTNIEVLNMMDKSLELMTTIKERKLQYIGHIVRGEKYEILRLVIEGKVQGKRSIGRRQNSWLKDLRRWLGRTSTEIFRGAASRVRIANWIANLRRETAL